MAPLPDRLVLFLVETADKAVAAALTATLERLGFDVQPTGPAAPDVELEYEDATFAIIGIKGSAEGSLASGRARTVQKATARLLAGRRVVGPSYAVAMSCVPVATDVEGVGVVELDADGAWLDRVEAMLLATGWTA